MNREDERDREIRSFSDRLPKLSEASLRINESLDFDAVLQGVLDSARALTQARYGAVMAPHVSRGVQDVLFSGLTVEQAKAYRELPGRHRVFRHLSTIPGPLRVADFADELRSTGLREFRLPNQVSSFLAVPIRHQGVNVGTINLAKSEPGKEFLQEDEETLVMFASQVALIIANARRYREEQRARKELETLIHTSPVGVVVFDARTGAPLLFNREIVRILDDLRVPDTSPEELLEVLILRRDDGREIFLGESSIAQLVSSADTERAEEIVLEVSDGRRVSALMNCTPIHSEGGEVDTLVVTLQDMTAVHEVERLRAEFLGMVNHELGTSLEAPSQTCWTPSPDSAAPSLFSYSRSSTHRQTVRDP